MLPDYQLVESIALTARHALYRATHTATGRRVVLKRARRDYPLPEDVLRLEFERHLLSALRGPGVIELLAAERVAGSPVLVLEDFGARSLADVPLPLSLPDFFAVAEGCIRALARVNAAGVVHRDMKPSNVLWNRSSGELKLIDFQLAAELSREHGELEAGAELHGSLPYLSPEQTGRMNRSLDYRSDYYSLGVTLFELLTGQLPFAASDVMGWVHCHVSKQPPLASELNPSVPPALALLVAKLMKKEPSQRYQSSRGLLGDLRRLREAREAGRSDDRLELGTHDVSERFSVSRRLVGRGAEVETLLAAFERASSGEARLLCVGGYAGVGKSSLIAELQRPITVKGGYFAAGKFDQLERSVPYAALLTALRELIHQLLAESEPRIEACRERILAEVGTGLSLVVEVLPELTKIVGPQAPPERVDARAAQSRFRNAFARFVRALARPDAPLVLCLDDMQWTDASTPELLVEIVARGDARHLLLIVAFRDNEVLGGHLLQPALREVSQLAPERVDAITLGPLGPAALGELVASSLHTTPERCASLTAVIAEKSQGNPFFAGELLVTLHRQRALRLDAARGEWTWDMAAVRAAGATDNVVELMVQRLAVLPAASIAALRLAACLGNTFSLSAVAALLETDAASVAEALGAPTRDGAIVPLDEGYRFMRWAAGVGAAIDARFRFQHDRVQEAAYSLIPASERAPTHLRIGRLLAKPGASALAAADLFAVCNQLNLGRALIDSLAEREQLMLLNQQAASKASAATAFGVAARHLDAAANALTSGEWAERPALRFELFSARVTSVLMAGELDRAAALCDELFAHALNDAQRGQVFLLKCNVSLYQANLVAAVDAVRHGLRLFGIELPSEPDAIGAGIGAGIGKMQAHLARVGVDQLPDLPELTDPGLSVAMQLLFNVVPAAIMISPPLFVLAELLMFDAALTHGLSAVCAKNLVDCGMIQGQFLGDYTTAYRLGKAAFRVMDRFGARALGTSVHFVFAGFVSAWGAPYEEALASCQVGKKLSVESGDALHLAYHNVLYPRLLLLMGRPLPECATECREAMALVTRLGASVQALGVRLCQRAVERLTDAASTPLDAARADEALERDIVASGNHQWGFQGGEVQLFASVLLGDWEAAARWSELARRHEQAGSTYLAVPEFHLLECLLTARQRWPGANEEARRELLAECRQRRDRLQGWALGCAENYEPAYALAAAEVARLADEPMGSVLALYERAARTAGQRFLHLHALALELESHYLRDSGCEALADGALERAVALYAHWGAAAKIRRLATQRMRLFAAGDGLRGSSVAWSLPAASRNPTATAIGVSNLDMESVLKATQAISREVKSDRLYALLMHTMAENAGAERGCLVLPDGSAGVGRVYARTGQGHAAHSLPAEPDEQAHRICLAVLRYVARSQSELIIDDASAHPRFSREPYVQANGVKSVLCLPVLHQGALSAILYLENDATTHAFTADRVRALRVLAGQAAISIANAQLYATLEQRVEERTRELSAKTRKVEAMLHGIHQGVFTIDADLRVQPEYSEHLPRLLDERDLVGRPLGEVLFEGSHLSADARSRNESALLIAFGAPASMAALNAPHLIQEFTRPSPDGTERVFEVDWNWIVDENDV
ncbi:MAG TPA: AAA family ATPase, partial [Polyangiaceae bacterium]|nr:AAA family ATPase [Polyangiaceae bacterium]